MSEPGTPEALKVKPIIEVFYDPHALGRGIPCGDGLIARLKSDKTICLIGIGYEDTVPEFLLKLKGMGMSGDKKDYNIIVLSEIPGDELLTLERNTEDPIGAQILGKKVMEHVITAVTHTDDTRIIIDYPTIKVREEQDGKLYEYIYSLDVVMHSRHEVKEW